METVIIQSDPKDYAFKKIIDEHKHLDCDEHRHTIKPIIHVINKDFKGQEHLFCDKDQLCPLGKYRRPKKLIEAEQKGFASVSEMMEAAKKDQEEKKQKEIETLTERSRVLEEHARDVQKKFDDYIKLTNERFDKIALLFESKK